MTSRATPWAVTPDRVMAIGYGVLALVAAAWVGACSLGAYVAAWQGGFDLSSVDSKQRIVFSARALAGDVDWPNAPTLPTVWFWVTTGFAFSASVAALGVLAAWMSRRRRRARTEARLSDRNLSPVWARRKDLDQLVVEWPADRWSVGSHRGRLDLAAPSHSSVSVIAPTRSGKTVTLVVPSVLRFDGSLIVVSSKPDVVQLTAAHRATVGPVFVFDPTNVTKLGNCVWSPLKAAGDTFAQAKRTAQVFVEATGVEHSAANAKFFQEQGSKLIACVLRAATAGGCSLLEISRWLHDQDGTTVAELLTMAGEDEALAEWRGAMLLPPETRGGVFGTAQMLFAAFSDPEVADRLDSAPDLGDVIDPSALMAGGEVFTLFVVCPDDAARRLRPVFEALLGLMLQAGYSTYAGCGLPLEPTVGVILEEAGNIAAPVNLDVIASSFAGAGMPIMTVWQDAGQIEHRYGEKARTVMANHTTQVVLPGNLDDTELKRIGTMIGKHQQNNARVNGDARGSSLSIDNLDVDVAPPEWLRQLPSGTAVVLSRNTPPILVKLSAWFEDPSLRQLIPTEIALAFDSAYGTGPKGNGRRKAAA